MKAVLAVAVAMTLTACASQPHDSGGPVQVTSSTQYGAIGWTSSRLPVRSGFRTGCAGEVQGCPGTGGSQ